MDWVGLDWIGLGQKSSLIEIFNVISSD